MSSVTILDMCKVYLLKARE